VGSASGGGAAKAGRAMQANTIRQAKRRINHLLIREV
jgi:hypothetical protein